MIRLSNIRIAVRFASAIAIPLAVFICLAGYDLLQSWRVRSEMTRLNHMGKAVAGISRLVHQLQRERGASAVFVGSHGTQLRDQVAIERRDTDKERATAQEFFSEIGELATTREFKDAIAKSTSAVAQLDNMRNKIDGLNIAAQDSNSYFTDTIAKLLVVTGEIAKVSSNGEASRAIAAYVSFMQGKERAGQERAVGAAGISQGKFELPDYVHMLELRAAQDVYFNAFSSSATPAQRDFFQRTLSAPVVKTLADMREVITRGGLSGAMQGINGKSWFDTTTARIDLLKTVEDRIAADLVALTTRIQADATSTLTALFATIAIAFAFSVILAYVISRSVTHPLTGLNGAMRQLADGNFDVVLPGLGRKDEIGEIADAVEGFKIKAAEKAQREAEEKAEQDKRAAAEREAAMQKMADEFEAAVGGIVKAAVAGDFTQRVDLQGKTGLVFNVGTAINSLCENVAKALDDLIKMLNALADGNLTQRITAQYHGNFGLLKDNANKTAERVGTTITEIKASAAEVTNASAEISTSTTDLSQRTEEQAASLEETSASMEEISATVKKNAENAQRANQSAADTRTVAERGGEVVADAVKAMAKIEESSRKISDIIGVIDEIARQTNLLALNAAVEAARAGEAGRGFAVVASEVRSLAQRASQAAKDIKDLITNSNGQVKEGVDLVNKAGSSLNEIVDSIKKVAAIVSDIANASAEQATGIEQVGKALMQMDEVTQQNSALVEENAATAKTLEHQANAMDQRVAFFKLAAGSDVAPAMPLAAAPQRSAALVPTRGPAAKAAHKAQPAEAKTPELGKEVAPKRAGGPVGRMQAALATAVNEDPDWKEF